MSTYGAQLGGLVTVFPVCATDSDKLIMDGRRLR